MVGGWDGIVIRKKRANDSKKINFNVLGLYNIPGHNASAYNTNRTRFRIMLRSDIIISNMKGRN